MRFSTNQPRFYGGLALPARTMDVCIVSPAGARLLPRHRPAAPEPFLQAVTPSRAGLVGAVACLVTWSGLAALCAAPAIPCGLGPALSRQAIPGGQANTDPREAPKRAAVRRGGLLPQAAGSPAALRSTRALLRRRTPRRRTRAARVAPGPKTPAPSHWPAIGKPSASQAHREGVAARFHDPAVPKTLAGDLALLPSDEAWLRALELSLGQTAPQHEAPTLSGLHPGPGMGTLLRLGLLDDLPDIDRWPRGQDWAAYARLGQGSHASAGPRWGTSGKHIGTAPLTGALAAAAPWCRRNQPHGPQLCGPAGSNNRAKAKRCASAPLHWRGPSMTGASAPPLALWRPADVPHGAERVSLAPHGPRTGGAGKRHAPSPVRLRLAPRRWA